MNDARDEAFDRPSVSPEDSNHPFQLNDQSRPGWMSPSFQLICRFAKQLHFGTLHIALPNGSKLTYAGKEQTHLTATLVVNKYAFARRTIIGGDIGFFEAYADGQWDTPDLAQLLFLLALNADHIASAFDGSPVAAIVEQIRHYWGRKNTRTGSRRNISSHYDLGNTFYEKWLDPSMTYSSAKFGNDVGDLEGAQDRKYQSLGEQMRLQEGDHVLEIGSGWGGFAEFAAKHFQAKITGLTISKEQFDYASERIFREGLSERVTFKLQDYRDADGEYDKVASIEMFEAVGREYWPTYFQKVHALLKPGGAAGIQVITIADRLFAQYLRSIDFIQRYVFPGGMLPSPTALRSQVDNAGLAWREAVHFGEDYAKTLAFWHERFVNQWSEIQPLGFDERFKKLWRFYLAYCEAGFRAKTTDVLQATLVRT